MTTARHREQVRMAPGTAAATALRTARETTTGIRVMPGTAVAEHRPVSDD